MSTSTYLDSESVYSETVKPYEASINTNDDDDDDDHHHHNRENLISRIYSRISARNEDEKELKSLISNNKGVERIVSHLQEKAGQLGPLEEPIDLQKCLTHPDPNSDYNEDDEWKYPIDLETKLRLVEFVPNDKHDPLNTSKTWKWIYTGLLGLICFVVALGSAIVTGDLHRPQHYFGVSQTVIILASVTMFVLGFGVGPMVFAPISEEIGRKPVYASSLLLGVIFIIPCGLAKNIGTLIICRLIDGIAFSAPMCLIGGSLADIWVGAERGIAFSVFSAAPFLGPTLGPIFGGLLADNSSTWRWTYWTLLIIACFGYCVFIIIVPETYAPAILKKRAKELRKKTGDSRYRTIAELQPLSFKETAKRSILRPFLLLSELIVFLVTLYMSVIYGLLYMFFFAYPMIYEVGKGWSSSKTGIMFIPIAVGVLLATSISPWINRHYNSKAQPYRDRGELPPAELRLYPMMIGCWFVVIGLFPFAWTSAPHISWAGPCFSGLAVGFGFLMLYNPANNYIVDSYQHYASSALAAKTLVRSLWGACVPLFTIQMYHRLGLEWASTLMAFIALACCAIPYVFFIYGARIRKHSKYAYAPDLKPKDIENQN